MYPALKGAYLHSGFSIFVTAYKDVLRFSEEHKKCLPASHN